MKTKDIFANRFNPAVYDQKNLINFENKAIWMRGVEKTSNPLPTGFTVFAVICAICAGYFIFR